MRDAARELADGLHLLRLPQLLLGSLQSLRALFHPLLQGRVEVLQGLLSLVTVCFVTRDLDEPLRRAIRVRRQHVHRAIHEHAATVLADVPAHVERLAMRCCGGDLPDVRAFGTVLGGEDDGYAFADDVFLAPTKCLFRTYRPVGDDALGIQGQDGMVLGVLDDQAQPGFALRQTVQGVAQFGDVVAFDKNTNDLPGSIPHRLVDKIQQASTWCSRGIPKMKLHALANKTFTRGIHPVEQVEERHPFLGIECFADGMPYQRPHTNQAFKGLVGQFEPMRRPAQHGHEARRFQEQGAQAITLGFQGQIAFVDRLRPLEDPCLLRTQGQSVGVRHRLLEPFEFGDIDGMLQHDLHIALIVENRNVADAPVPFLEPTALRFRSRHIKPQQRHHIGLSRGDHPLE